jgi:valyl-tRNA synthetase
MRFSLINKNFRLNNNKRSSSFIKNNINYISSSSTSSSNNNNNQIPLFEKEFESKYFEFKNIENNIYKWWEYRGYFQPSNDLSKEKFVISMPPPNVTGHLHMGHAMFITLQDIMIRFHRMRGKSVLWLPGT